MSSIDPNQYVEENSDQLAYIIKHSNDRFVRSLCLAAMIEYGQDGDITEIKKQLEKYQSKNDK